MQSGKELPHVPLASCRASEGFMIMTSSTSSSLGRARARMRVERNRKRALSARRRDRNSSSGSEDDRKRESLSHVGRHDRSGHTERRSRSGHGRSRRRKRSKSSSPSRERRKRSRRTSDSGSSLSRSKREHTYSHRKFSSYHQRHWDACRSCRHHGCCRGSSHCRRDREKRFCSKRKERENGTSPASAARDEHCNSRSNDSISHSSKNTLRTSKVRRQTSCDVNYPHDDSDSPRDGSLTGLSQVATQQKVRSKKDLQLHSAEQLVVPTGSRERAFAGLSRIAKQCTASTSGLFQKPSVRTGEGSESAPGLKTIGAAGGLGRQDIHLTRNIDWLDLSLKAPTKPTPRVVGISREDLKLSLDSSVPSAPVRTCSVREDLRFPSDSNGPNTPVPTSQVQGIHRLSLYSGTLIAPGQYKEPMEGEVRPECKGTCVNKGHLTQISTRGGGCQAHLHTSLSLLPECADHFCESSDVKFEGRPGTDVQKGTRDTQNGTIFRAEEDLLKFSSLSGCRDRTFFKSKEVYSSCRPTIGVQEGTMSKTKDLLKHQNCVLELSDSSDEHPNNVDAKEVCSYSDQQISVNHGNNVTVETRCFFRQLGSPSRHQNAAPRLFWKQSPCIDHVINIVELSNSISSQEDDEEKPPNNQEVDFMGCSDLLKANVDTSTRQNTLSGDPSLLGQVWSLARSLDPILHLADEVVDLSDSSLKDDTDAAQHENEVQNQNTASISFEAKVKLCVCVPNHSSGLKGTLPQETTSLTKRSSSEQALLPKHCDSGVKLLNPAFVNEDGAVDLRTAVDHDTLRSNTIKAEWGPSQNNGSPLPQTGECTRLTTPGFPLASPPNVEVVELSDSSSSNHSDDYEMEPINYAEAIRVLGVNRSQLNSPLSDTRRPEAMRYSQCHDLDYLSQGFAIKPSTKKTHSFGYEGVQHGQVTYLRDKHGNLIQVVDVDDSEDEEEGEVKQRASLRIDDAFDRDQQVRSILAEIRQEIDRGNFSQEESDEDVDAEKHSFHPSVAVPSQTKSELRDISQKNKLRKLVLDESESQDSDESLEREDAASAAISPIGPNHQEKWKRGILCDLCNKGPSLSLGEWYCWCCGTPATRCHCLEEKRTRKLMSLGFRKAQKRRKRGKQILVHQWSGKVHKMCALWSSEVFVKDIPNKESPLQLLEAAVKRGNTIICRDPDCKKVGATLGCRVRSCRRSYHYPCAEKLAAKCLVRMWDGATIPIACPGHRYVEEEADRARERPLPSRVTIPDRDGKAPIFEQTYIGTKLLCEDIAVGQEAVRIPCTNDIDDEPAPRIKYITKCWYKGRSVITLHPCGTELAKSCQGCAGFNFDNPAALISVHVLCSGSRESDQRVDWQGERMYGRLPYNAAGLLQLGPESKDIIECNSGCKCGPKCKNRELQKGLQCSLELFKTLDRGWGVRALEQIPRGRFVVEYVGDVLTQAEADERGEKYDQNQLSYLFNLDHPGVHHKDAIVLDGIKMSNIARFINHSCEGNLMIYRVYTETTELRYFRIGMYAIQDIEVGEELSYDYNYACPKDSSGLVDDPTAIRCFCGAPTCRKWLWRGGSESQLMKH